METKESFRGCNPITEAYTNGQASVCLERNKNNIYRLCRFRKKFKAKATGKEIGDKFVVVFWDNLIKQKEA